MKKVCIIILNLQIMVWMSGCMVQETESAMILQNEQGPFVVHISSAVEPEPIETPVYTGVDWEDIIELSEEMLQDEESLRELLPEPVRILDFVQGDIGEDGKDEIVIIYEYPEIADSNCFLRKVAVFTAEESFTCVAFHETLIPDSLSGGMMGDPYVGTYIQNGDLGFSIYGGSAWRWSYDIWFSMEENQLILRKLIDTSSHIHSGDHIYMTYDYERQRTICEAGWYVDEFHREELYRYDWDEEIDVPMFQEVYDMFGDEEIPSIDIPLAISDLFYSSYQLREQEVDFSASEILDKVKEMYYPSMERIDHRTQGINFENISSYLGYQIPEYHYEDRNGLQLYYRTARYDEEFGWNHEIGIQSRNGGVYDEIFYEEEDTWCEEQLRLLAQNEQIVEYGIFVGENGGQYTVTDWNHNGRLEIIFSYNTGSGRSDIYISEKLFCIVNDTKAGVSLRLFYY